jgi:hypothetical protein
MAWLKEDNRTAFSNTGVEIAHKRAATQRPHRNKWAGTRTPIKRSLFPEARLHLLIGKIGKSEIPINFSKKK